MLKIVKDTWIILPVCLLFACRQPEPQQEEQEMPVRTVQPQPVEQKTMPENDTVAEQNAFKLDTTLFPVSRKVLETIRKKNYAALSEYVHPKKGIRFSPYAYIDTTTHKKFTKKELAKVSQEKKYAWGHRDGSGELINMNISNYFDRFVYDANYLVNASVAQNDFLCQGNSMNNLKETYPGCDFTEFYFKGNKPEMGGMDWKTLRLVFKTENGNPYLVAVVHDEWTI